MSDKEKITIQGKDRLKDIKSFTLKSALGFHSWKREPYRTGQTPKWNGHSQYGYSTSHLAPVRQ